ncbi:MAG: hypothetical protein ABI678_26525 [Kofleriaceae bacterium]
MCCAFAVALVACAMGGSQTHQGNPDAPPADGQVSTFHDAPMSTGDAAVFHDAPHQALDAFVFHDAPQSGSDGDPCSTNMDCNSNLGFCCFVVACVSGTGIGSNICLPN